jgi:predicted RNA binding protein YcfA (HicA-like mRNA interferase family)
MNNRKSIDELERDGWEKIDVFSHEYYVMSRGSQRMVVDEDGEIIVVY